MRMRLGVRGREALVVSLLTLLVVSTATAIHLSQLSRVVVQEAVKQAELIAKQIYAQTGRALQRTPGADPLDALRDDPELRSFLDASVGYSPASRLRARRRPYRHRAAPHRAPEGGQAEPERRTWTGS